MINQDLIPNLIYSSTNKAHIFKTDHSAVTAYFSIDDLFKQPQMAALKRHKIDKIIDHSKITPELWKNFTDSTDN